MCYTPGIFLQHISLGIFSGKRYLNDILWIQACDINTLLLGAIVIWTFTMSNIRIQKVFVIDN
jgi:hypothetical protein